MAKAVLCPICGGSGKIVRYENSYIPTTAIPSNEQICNGCSGKGWVEVSD